MEFSNHKLFNKFHLLLPSLKQKPKPGVVSVMLALIILPVS